MNQLGQTSLTVFFILIIFGIIFFAGFGAFIGESTINAVMANNITGVEGWFFSSTTFIYTLGFVLALMGVGYYTMR